MFVHGVGEVKVLVLLFFCEDSFEVLFLEFLEGVLFIFWGRQVAFLFAVTSNSLVL